MPSETKLLKEAIVATLTPKTYTLLEDADATGAAVEEIFGGAYQWRAVGTFDGATLTLQILEDDGETWSDVDTLAAAGDKTVVIGQGSSVRVEITGGDVPEALYSSLRGLGSVSVAAA